MASSALARAFDAVATATTALVSAAREGDPDGIRRAVQARGEAIDRLEGPLRRLARQADAGGEPLAEQRAALAESTALARTELQRLTAQIRAAFEHLERDAEAIRSYNPSSSPAAVLDRST